MTALMFERIQPHLPSVYRDREGVSWTYESAPKFIMYSKINPGQQFPIHTDTGCEYGKLTSRYTVLTYLNDDFEGGHTQFYNSEFKKTVSIVPKRGKTLCFDINLFHAGDEVFKTAKYWIGTELVCRRSLL